MDNNHLEGVWSPNMGQPITVSLRGCFKNHFIVSADVRRLKIQGVSGEIRASSRRLLQFQNTISDFLLVGIFIAVGGGFAVDAFGAWVGEGFFDPLEMGGILAELGGVAAEFLAEFGQPAVDDGAGGTAFPGDLAGAQAVHAVEAKDGVEADFTCALAAIQGFDGGEGPAGGIVVLRLFWLGREFGEEFAGGGAGVEGAVVGEGEVGVEGEEFGAEVGQEFLAGGVEVLAGGGEEDELFPEPGGQHGDDVLEIVALALDGEDDGDGVAGPGADLDGVGEAKVSGPSVQTKSFAEGAAQFGPVEFQDYDVGGGEDHIIAIPRLAGADGDDVVGSVDGDIVSAAAFAAGEGFGGFRARLEEGASDGVKLVSSAFAPDRGDCAGADFEGCPDVRVHVACWVRIHVFISFCRRE